MTKKEYKTRNPNHIWNDIAELLTLKQYVKTMYDLRFRFKIQAALKASKSNKVKNLCEEMDRALNERGF